MLHFVSKELTVGYLLLSFLSALGVLQWVAARYRLVGLALLDYSERRIRGYGLAGLLVTGSAVWFFVSQWTEILTPGPAGAELSVLFGTGAMCALAVTLIMASLLQHLRNSTPPQDTSDQGQTVTIGCATGRLHIPPSPTEPMPAICIVPRLGASAESMGTLARRMVREGLVVLVVNLDEELCAYPGILAILPAAMSLLSKSPEVDPQRLGALGHDLGGDLVIRAASADKQIKAVAALAPLLVDAPVGLGLMQEMPYLQALRWALDRKRTSLRADLNALKYGAKIAPRPLLLVCGAEDRLVTNAPIEEWHVQHRDSITCRTIQGAGHFNLVDHPTALRTAVQWFKEHL